MRSYALCLSIGLTLALSMWLHPATARADSQPNADKAAKETKKETKKSASREAKRKKRASRILSGNEVADGLRIHVRKISECFKEHAIPDPKISGELRLGLTIKPTGFVRKVRVYAPGLRKPKKLRVCIQTLSKSWQFPEKPGFTHASIPFLFLRKGNKKTGPFESCWDPKGCPSKARKRRNKRKKSKK